MSSWGYSIASAFLAVCVYFVFRRWKRFQQWLTEISKIPGPEGKPIIGNFLQLQGGQDRFHHLLQLSRTYNGVFRIQTLWQAVVFVCKPAAVEVILSSSKYNKKPFPYRLAKPWLGEGLLISYGEKWKMRRKMLTPTFHFKILNDFVRVFVEESRNLVSRLKDHKDQEAFDIYPYLSAFTLDTICRTAMGRSLHVQKGEGSSYVEACARICGLAQNRVWYPWQWSSWLYNLTPSGRAFNKCLDVLHGFTNGVIEEKLKETTHPHGPAGKTKRGLMALLDLLTDAYNCGEISKEGIREEVDTFMFEGHDTTASGLCWTLFLLGSHPDVQETLAKEVEQFFEMYAEDEITTEQLKTMPYFDCVIKESLRLYPPVPVFSREIEEDTVLDGYAIPKGTTVAMFPTALHWNPDVWPDPMKFDPDRFLPENADGRHPFAYIPFSGGIRNCIGQRFALFEMKVLLAFVLRRYRVVVKPQTFEELKPVGQLVMRPKDGMWVKLVSRS